MKYLITFFAFIPLLVFGEMKTDSRQSQKRHPVSDQKEAAIKFSEMELDDEVADIDFDEDEELPIFEDDDDDEM